MLRVVWCLVDHSIPDHWTQCSVPHLRHCLAALFARENQIKNIRPSEVQSNKLQQRSKHASPSRICHGKWWWCTAAIGVNSRWYRETAGANCLSFLCSVIYWLLLRSRKAKGWHRFHLFCGFPSAAWVKSGRQTQPCRQRASSGSRWEPSTHMNSPSFVASVKPSQYSS